MRCFKIANTRARDIKKGEKWPVCLEMRVETGRRQKHERRSRAASKIGTCGERIDLFEW